MNSATATGWAMKTVWEPASDLVMAPMRSAMNRSASGGMALSFSGTRYQDGFPPRRGGVLGERGK
jgi:hypothetical protein